MKFKDVLYAIDNGPFQLIIKLPDGERWQTMISEGMIMHHQLFSFLEMVFGNEWKRMQESQVLKIQIVVTAEESKNKLYVLLGSSDESKAAATYTKDLYIDAENILYVNNIDGQVIPKDKIPLIPDSILSGLKIDFACERYHIDPCLHIILARTGIGEYINDVSASQAIDVPPFFQKQVIEKLPPDEYARKYHVTTETASVIQAFAQKEYPSLEDYASLKVNRNDYWSKAKIGLIYLPDRQREAALAVINKYISSPDAIGSTFRWYMRGLPLETAIRRVLAIRELNFRKREKINHD